MKRRSFLKESRCGRDARVVAAPAIAQSQPPSSGAWRQAGRRAWTRYTRRGAHLQPRGEATGASSPSSCRGGEIVGGLQVMDACSNGTVECGHTGGVLLLRQGPDVCVSARTFRSAWNARQQYAWYYHGGGLELMREFYKDYNIVTHLAGNTGCQMGGWYRKPISRWPSLKGLKFRIGERGTVLRGWAWCRSRSPAATSIRRWKKARSTPPDGSGPYDDEKLGFYKVAKTITTRLVGERFIARVLCRHQGLGVAPQGVSGDLRSGVRRGLHLDALEIRRAQPGGAQAPAGQRREPCALPERCEMASFKASEENYEEVATKNPKFKKVWEPWKKFRDEQVQWFSIAEGAWIASWCRRNAPRNEAQERKAAAFVD